MHNYFIFFFGDKSKYLFYYIGCIVTHISPEYLRCIRRNAVRKRTWFQALDKLERGIVNLTIKIVDSLKSQLLTAQIVTILVKLRDAAKCAFTKHVESYGYQKLRETVETAVSLGNNAAQCWIRELGFAEWFASNDYNNSVGWR
jgi:hypothetical protein